MKLSIIVPTFNEEKTISSLLNNISNTCNIAHEVIIVDGGSSDQTLYLADKNSNIIVESKKGRAIQQNAGAKIAKGNYLLFIHSDSFLPEKFYTDIKNDWGYFTVKLSGQSKAFRVIEFMMNLRSRLTSITTGDQGIFVLNNLFKEVGGFANLSLMEDIELCTRLKKKAKPYSSRLKITTSSRKWERNGVAKTILSMWWYRLQFYFGIDSKVLEKKYYRN